MTGNFFQWWQISCCSRIVFMGQEISSCDRKFLPAIQISFLWREFLTVTESVVTLANISFEAPRFFSIQDPLRNSSLRGKELYQLERFQIVLHINSLGTNRIYSIVSYWTVKTLQYKKRYLCLFAQKSLHITRCGFYNDQLSNLAKIDWILLQAYFHPISSYLRRV